MTAYHRWFEVTHDTQKRIGVVRFLTPDDTINPDFTDTDYTFWFGATPPLDAGIEAIRNLIKFRQPWRSRPKVKDVEFVGRSKSGMIYRVDWGYFSE